MHWDYGAGNLENGFAETIGGKKNVDSGGRGQQAQFQVGQENDAEVNRCWLESSAANQPLTVRLVDVRFHMEGLGERDEGRIFSCKICG